MRERPTIEATENSTTIELPCDWGRIKQASDALVMRSTVTVSKKGEGGEIIRCDHALVGRSTSWFIGSQGGGSAPLIGGSAQSRRKNGSLARSLP